jgi:hypothetical protein
MNKLIAIAAAAIAGLLFSRRKTLKEDSKRMTSTAKDQAANLTGRIRGGCEAGDDIDDPGADAADQDPESAEETETDTA